MDTDPVAKDRVTQMLRKHLELAQEQLDMAERGVLLSIDGAPEGDDSPEDQLYRRAIQLVAESQKASTSWLQRQLRVGYNIAARLIERMEKDELVSRPDHVGRREVLMDTDGRQL